MIGRALSIVVVGVFIVSASSCERGQPRVHAQNRIADALERIADALERPPACEAPP